ncbi:MAG TPA: hypothetical protein VFE60_01895 [Roseiarcus sp.]|jgi:hypothetical protein|nr:hypothetical protein [Roseiarcus sp.]
MPTSAWYQGESLKRLLQGAAVGVVATLAVGFGWGGWMLGSSARTLADSTANSAVVAAIAPICVDQFQRSADAANNLTALKKTDSWQQAAYVEKGGWAMMPGSKAVDSGVPQALRRHSQQPEVASSAASNTTDDDRRDARRTSLLSTPECEGQLNRD